MDVSFARCGWAHTEPVDGVAFVIQCPDGRDAQLYYQDDDMRSEDDIPWMERLRAGIARYSRGLRNVHVHIPDAPFDPNRDWETDEGDRLCIRFALSEGEPDKPLPLYDVGWQKTAEDVRDPFVLVLPRCGEFEAMLGEVCQGRYLRRYSRGFCMK